MRPYFFVFCCEALELLLWFDYKLQGEHSDYCVIQVLLCYCVITVLLREKQTMFPVDTGRI